MPNPIGPVPPHTDEFLANQGGVSLPFAMFRVARPEVALAMMEAGHAPDLNETDANGVSLLAIKCMDVTPRSNAFSYDMQTPSPMGLVPTWPEWMAHKMGAFPANRGGANSASDLRHQLIASMIFHGADPWTRWDAKFLDGTCNTFADLMCLKKNHALMSLLLSHPNRPTAEELDAHRLEATAMLREGYNYGQPASNHPAPWLHFLVNQGEMEMVSMLVAAGMDINQKDDQGRTPLFYALKKEVVEETIKLGAKIHLADHQGKTVVGYWKTALSTAARQSEFNRIIIDKMKVDMTPDEVREFQKPDLFEQVLAGTKGGFETIYRKSKFKKDVTIDFGRRGVWNLMTAALANKNTDKANVFVRTFEEMGVDWSHELWPGTGVTNKSIAMISPQFTYAIPYFQGQPTRPTSLSVDKLVGLAIEGGFAEIDKVNAVGRYGHRTLQRWCALMAMACWPPRVWDEKAYTPEKNMVETALAFVRASAPELKTTSPQDIMKATARHLNAHADLWVSVGLNSGLSALKSFLKEAQKTAPTTSGLYDIQSTRFQDYRPVFFEMAWPMVEDKIAKDQPGWRELAVVLSAVSVAVNPMDISGNVVRGGNKVITNQWRENVIRALPAEAPEAWCLSGEQEDLIEKTCAIYMPPDVSKSTGAQQLMVWVGRNAISRALTPSSSPPSSAPRRRM